LDGKKGRESVEKVQGYETDRRIKSRLFTLTRSKDIRNFVSLSLAAARRSLVLALVRSSMDRHYPVLVSVRDIVCSVRSRRDGFDVLLLSEAPSERERVLGGSRLRGRIHLLLDLGV